MMNYAIRELERALEKMMDTEVGPGTIRYHKAQMREINQALGILGAAQGVDRDTALVVLDGLVEYYGEPGLLEVGIAQIRALLESLPKDKA